MKQRRQRSAINAAADPKIGGYAFAFRVQHVMHVPESEPGPEIRRDRIETAAGHDARAVGSSLRVMPIDLLTDPRGLARDIAVMSTVAHAGLNQFCAVKTKRSGGAGNDPGLSRQTIQRIIVLGIGEQHISPRKIDAIELGAISSCNCPG